MNKIASIRKDWKLIEMLIEENRSILDIGCGPGTGLKAFQDQGWSVTGVEPDPVRAKVANETHKLNVLNCTAEAMPDQKEKYDLILIKQTIHFFTDEKLNHLLNLAKERLNPKGKLLIFSLKTKNNKIPCFKKMKQKLDNSLARDKKIFKTIKKNLGKTKVSHFNFKVKISKQKYLRINMVLLLECGLKERIK